MENYYLPINDHIKNIILIIIIDRCKYIGKICYINLNILIDIQLTSVNHKLNK